MLTVPQFKKKPNGLEQGLPKALTMQMEIYLSGDSVPTHIQITEMKVLLKNASHDRRCILFSSLLSSISLFKSQWKTT